MDIERKKILRSVIFPILLVIIMLAFLLYSELISDLYYLGVYPLSIKGLVGIFTSVLVHSDFSHFFSNSIPIIVLGSALFYYYKNFAFQALILMWLTSGFWVWVMGRENYHIGASGLVYALAGFHIISAFIRRDFRLMAFAMLVIFLYGSLIWGIFPDFYPEKNISWEGHLMGGLAGILYAIYFRKKDINLLNKRYSFEEDDLGSDYIWPEEFYEDENE